MLQALLLFAAVLLAGGSCLLDHLSSHPLFSRTIKREDLPKLLSIFASARDLPLSPTFQVIGLIQGEQVIEQREAILRETGVGLVRLVFREPRLGSLYFPTPHFSEGRNALLAAASELELHFGQRYTYYLLLDDDAPGQWRAEWPPFSAFLQQWEPAIGLPTIPGYVEHSPGWHPEGPWSVFAFDHMVMAVHSDAAAVLFPYNSSMDAKCTFTSQWKFNLLAGVLFPGHVLLSETLKVSNTRVGGYTKLDCPLELTQAAVQLREELPHVADCFPDHPFKQQIAIINNSVTSLLAYLPWHERTRRRDESGTVVHYNSVDFSSLSNCSDNPTMAAVMSSQDYLWCPGCSLDIAVYKLQSKAARNPLESSIWVHLANMLACEATDVQGIRVATGCVGIAFRLIRCSGGEPALFSWSSLNLYLGCAESILKVSLVDLGAQSVDFERDVFDQTGNIFKIVRAALTVRSPLGEKHLLDESKILTLVDILTECPTSGINYTQWSHPPREAEAEAGVSYSWCPGCTYSVALSMLQSTVAVAPMQPSLWLHLSNLMACSATEIRGFKVAIGCLGIVFRMLRCGKAWSRISWSDLSDDLSAFRECAKDGFGFVLNLDAGTAEEIERKTFTVDKYAFETVRVALSTDRTGGSSKLTESQAMELVDMLLQCPSVMGVSTD